MSLPLKTTTIANANIISSLQPVLIALVVGKLFGERLDGWFFVWSTLALVGVVAVLTGSAASNADTHTYHGDLLALLATCSWAAFFVASKQARKTLTSLEYLAGLLVVAWAVITPVAFHRMSGARRWPSTSAGTWLIVASAPGGCSPSPCSSGAETTAIATGTMNWCSTATSLPGPRRR